MHEPSLGAKLGAEFLGTFWLVFGGCGSAVLSAKYLSTDNFSLGIGFLGVALAFGLTVLTGAYAFGHVGDQPPRRGWTPSSTSVSGGGTSRN